MNALYICTLVMMLLFYFIDDNKISMFIASISLALLNIAMFRHMGNTLFFMLLVSFTFLLIVSISVKTFPALAVIKKIKKTNMVKVMILVIFCLIIASVFLFELSQSGVLLGQYKIQDYGKIKIKEIINILLVIVTILPIAFSILREGYE